MRCFVKRLVMCVEQKNGILLFQERTTFIDVQSCNLLQVKQLVNLSVH